MKHFYHLFIGSLLSLIAVTARSQTTSRTTDSINLVNLYTATNGPSWTNSSNWASLTQPINTWYGVHLNAAGRVDSLTLTSNNLTGPLPGKLTDTLTMVVKIDLSNNKLTGSVPYLNNTNIRTYNLSHNQLSGTLGYFAQGGLATLDLSYNQITGAVPDYSNFNGLNILNLSHNLMTGSLSNQNFSHIQLFDISYNSFTGNVPYMDNANIISYNSSHNNFTGSLSYYNNPAALQVFNVSYNQLSSTLPYFTMPALTQLDVSHNNISGTLNYYSFPLIKIFDCSSNKINGSIPFYSFNGTAGTMLVIDSNKLTFTELEGRPGSFPAASVYAPQDTVLPVHYKLVGSKLSVSAGGTLSNNTYKWYLSTGTLAGTTSGDSTFTPTANGSYYVLVTNATSGVLTLASTTIAVSGILPVTFTGINATLINKDKAVLAKTVWGTATEINNKQFEVQRSFNGTNWSTIAVIASKAVSGNSTVQLSYAYEDDISLYSGVVYYKVKQVDYDGNFKFSSVVTVNKATAPNANIAVFPNPVSAGSFRIKLISAQSEQVQLRIVNSIGIAVYSKMMNVISGENSLQVNVANGLASGIYIVQVFNNSSEVIGSVKMTK